MIDLKYKLRCPTQKELINKTSVEILQAIIDLLNMAGFSFNPAEHRPDIQAFMDKYPDLIEENKETPKKGIYPVWPKNA